MIDASTCFLPHGTRHAFRLRPHRLNHAQQLRLAMRQLRLHAFDLCNLALQRLDQCLTLVLTRRRHQCLELLQGKPGLLRALDQLQCLQGLRRIASIAIGLAPYLADQALGLVEPYARRRQPTLSCQLTNIHRRPCLTLKLTLSLA
ncbi:hypothetical protein ACVWXR_003072 [Pseudomonas lurida]